MKKSDYGNIVVEREFVKGGKEFTYFLKIPFEDIAELKISVANRTWVNLGSGLVRHFIDKDGKVVNPDGEKIIGEGIAQGSSERRVLHWNYDKHMQELGIKDKQGNVIAPAYVNGWRDLGQNPWHVLWEVDPGVETYLMENGMVAERERDRLVRVAEDEEYGITRCGDLSTGRVYSCLVVPKQGNPFIKQLRFDENRDVYDESLEEKLSDSLEWAASGKALVRDGEPFDIYEIVEQYYDVAHIVPVSKSSPGHIDGRPDRPRKGELVQRLYRGYPEKFKENCSKALDEGLGTANYYFDIVGVNHDSLMILHNYGRLIEVASAAVQKGMRDAIIVDEGGSVATWAWYHGPNGGFENCSSYLRPSAIAVLGVKLRC